MALGMVIGLSACDVAQSVFPVRANEAAAEIEELETSVEVVRLTAQNIATYDRPRHPRGGHTTLKSQGGWTYRVGTGDVLDIVVWDHPELTMPAGDRRTPEESGLKVKADGTFFYPFVGQMPAKGLTPDAIRKNLTRALSEFIPDPQIEVRVVGYNSQSVSVTGKVNAPSRLPLSDIPMTLLEAIDAAGGLTEEADPGAVTVRRGGTMYAVDLEAFLEHGSSGNNPLMVHGDVVNVPEREVAEAYLLGQLVTPATVDLSKDDVTLTQALTRVGGLDKNKSDARGIFVFRETPDRIVVHQLDASNPVAFLLGTRFTLQPRDVVYVTTAPLTRWNRVITNLLPSIIGVKNAASVGN
ncbi:polysaccharide biosynthesis/export family protein [Pontibaca salina]|uniref:Polysaccharide biosynthesis/export family protein n=1 Tax=Pontibaca salina TaxID=2795731 RepID=A0A934HU14_9RHOB|nr:polysaccharide biosynthesis/export family protein [Pontibaca salina]MBI6630770.1 polysaccharide biosynthesis/export family protein [Pontibaca salina]